MAFCRCNSGVYDHRSPIRNFEYDHLSEPVRDHLDLTQLQEEARREGGNLLVIDADSTYSETVFEKTPENYSVYTAEHFVDGLDILHVTEIDIVLIDPNSPATSGLSVLEDLQNICPSASIIVFTAFGTIQNVISCLRMGIKDYLIKPVSAKTLVASIRKLMTEKRLSEMLYQTTKRQP